LQNLVDQYEALAALHAEQGGTRARQRMEDVAYTLCVSTETEDVDSALASARQRLRAAGTVPAGPEAD
jgi:hypothetical protein